jgi:hypothetical protein
MHLIEESKQKHMIINKNKNGVQNKLRHYLTNIYKMEPVGLQ